VRNVGGTKQKQSPGNSEKIMYII